MSNELEPVRNKPLTDTEFKYIQNVELGITPHKAFRLAVGKRTTQSLATFLDNSRKNVVFLEEEKRVAEQAREELSMSRQKVQKIITDAIDMAKVIGDPNAMIRAAAELNKMCGFYAPERQIIELSESATELKHTLESLNDEELLKLLERNNDSDIIDIEFTEVHEERSNP